MQPARRRGEAIRGGSILIGMFVALVTASGLARAQYLASPSVSINQAANQADPTAAPPINFTVVFSKPVTGFATGDVAIGGTAEATAAIVTGRRASVRIGFLLGDVSGNRVVTVSDPAQVNTRIAQAVNASNYLNDVNASGTLTVTDKGIANTRITKALPAP